MRTAYQEAEPQIALKDFQKGQRRGEYIYIYIHRYVFMCVCVCVCVCDSGKGGVHAIKKFHF